MRVGSIDLSLPRTGSGGRRWALERWWAYLSGFNLKVVEGEQDDERANGPAACARRL
jgi:hypothetical protein